MNQNIEKKILFYSSVKNKKTFYSHFYKMDIDILEDLGYLVEPCNFAKPFLKNDYDYAFLYFYRKSLLPCIIARLLGKKVYFTGGIDDLNKKTTSFRRYIIQYIFFFWCYVFSTKCIIVSNADIKNIYKVIKNDFLKKLVVIPNCLYRNTENYFFESLKENIFTTICFFEHDLNFFRKGIDRALILVSKLITFQEFSDSKFYIIGKYGENNSLLRKYVSDLSLTNVIITDEISTEDKYAILAKSKYYIQLSQYEGFGIAALEALFFKNIVIHSNKGGLSDFLKDFGVIYDGHDDIGSLVSSLNLVDKKQLDKAHNWVREHFSYDIRKWGIANLLKNQCDLK
jgi:hypothetical protein